MFKKFITTAVLFLSALVATAQGHVPTTGSDNNWTGINTFLAGKFKLGTVGQNCTPPQFMTGYDQFLNPVCQTVSALAGVAQINGATGNITLANGTNVTITQSPAGTFTFSSTGGVTTINGANGPITLAQGSGITIVESPSGTFTLAASGSAGTGTVVSGGPRNLAGYGNSGPASTVQPLSQIATVDNTMNLSQINAVVANFNCGICNGNTGSVIIPDGVGLTLPFFNQTVGFPATNPGADVEDWRTGAKLYQMTRTGLSCDARQVTITVTGGQTNFTVTNGTLSAADTGKWMPMGYVVGGYNGTQYRFTPTITYSSSTTGSFSTAAPASASGLVVWLGTNNTIALNGDGGTTTVGAMGAIGNQNLTGLLPAGCAALTDTVLWSNSQNVIGQSGATSILVGTPADDVVSTVDSAGHGVNNPGLVFGNMQIIPDITLDRTRPITNVDQNGNVTALTPFYRPIDNNTSAANFPLGPAWCIGCTNYVASVTQNSAVACVPTALGRMPAVGEQVMFRDTPTIFTSTVSSLTGAGCSGGFSPLTMASPLPNTSGYTLSQVEFVASTSPVGIQNLATAMSAGSITYPITITLSNPCAPVPSLDSNMAPTGRIKIGNEEYQYLGAGYSRASSTCTIALWNGPSTTVGWAASTAVAPENPCYAQRETPYPVTPSINTGDSTPSGARTFPGQCVGNAGIAFPEANGNVYVGNGLFRAVVDNLNISTSLFSPVNYASTTAGMYIAGNNQPYATTFSNIKMSGVAACLAEGEASYGQHGVASVGPTGQGDHFRDWSCTGAQPMTIMGNQDFIIDRVDAYSTALNPFNNTVIGSDKGLYMTYSLDEQTGNVVQSTAGGTITDWNAEPENGTHIVVPQYSDTNCYNCTWIGDLMEGAGQNIVGGSNVIIGGQWPGNLSNPVILYGSNETFNYTTDSATGKISNLWGLSSILNWGALNNGATPSAYGSGVMFAASPGLLEPTHGYDNDSFRDALWLTPPVSNKEGYFSPYEFGPNIDPASVEPNPFQIGYTVDPTAPYSGAWVGCNVTASSGCAPFHIGGFFGYYYIGPDQRVRDIPYVNTTMVKTTNNQVFNYQVNALDPGGANDTCPGSVTLLSKSVPTTAGVWTPVVNSVDFTGRSGCIIQFVYQNSTTADTVQVAYNQFQPIPGLILAPVATYTPGASCPIGVNGVILGSDANNQYWCSAGVIKKTPLVLLAITVLCHGTYSFPLSQVITSGSAFVSPTQTCSGEIAGSGGDLVPADFIGSPLGWTGFTPSASGGLFIAKYPVTNGVIFALVNNTANPITTNATTPISINYWGEGLR